MDLVQEAAGVADVVLQTHALVKRFGGITATNNVSLARRARRAPRADRPQRRRQDHADQPAHRRGAADLGPRAAGRRDITTLPPHPRVGRGLVRTFQINQLFASLTPLQSLALTVGSRRRRGVALVAAAGARRRHRRRVRALLEQFRLTEHADQRDARAGLRQAPPARDRDGAGLKPRVLLLDEPVAGVPAGERQDILDIVAALPADVSVLLIEHDMDLVFSFARRMTVLVNGAVLTEGAPRRDRRRPAGAGGVPRGGHAMPAGASHG